MTKRHIPLIGRIEEKLASSTGEPTRTEGDAPQTDSEVRLQADWLLERIRRTSSQFQSLALHGGLTNTHVDADPVVSRQRALLLAYKLTITAWRRRHDDHSSSVIDAVRNRVVRELDGVGRPKEAVRERTATSQPSTSESREAERRRILRTLVEPADSDISASIIRFEAGLPGPLTPFFGDLAPTFGGPCATEALASRYGKAVRHLYETIEKKLDERDRAEASQKHRSRYAGAGQSR